MSFRSTHRVLTFAVIAALLAGCASAPTESARESLDARTGTTLTRLPKPVELLSAETRSASGDPFAYFGPFQTNRMGAYALFLWVAVPVPAPEETQPGSPSIACDDKPVALVPIPGELADLGLSEPPYPLPAPWSKVTYYVLAPGDLECLRQASGAVLTLDAGGPAEEHFLATKEALSGLATFAADSTLLPAH